MRARRSTSRLPRSLGSLLLPLVAATACGGGDDVRAGEGEAAFLSSPPADAPAGTPPAPQAPQAEAIPREAAPAPPEVVQPPAAPAPGPKDLARQETDGERSFPAERELGLQLLHGPRPSLAALAGDGPRARLWRAFARAAEGDAEGAREESAGLESSRELTPGEARLLQSARTGAAAPPPETGEPELERLLRLALVERDARQAVLTGEDAAAAKAYTQLLRAELEGPWPADRASLARWSAALKDVQERHRWSRKGAWPSVEVEVAHGDSLIAIRKRVLAQHPGLLLSTGLIARANGLRDERAIRPGDRLRVPTDRAWALVDVDACWTLFLLGDEVADAWEVGVGKEPGSTRAGRFEVGEKQMEPMWFRDGMAPVPFGDPENPLGTRWLAWLQDGQKTSLGFHGTSDPAGIGGRVSQGCIRMRNEDVEVLFEILPRGADVVVQP